jgi:hypothetical protein
LKHDELIALIQNKLGFAIPRGTLVGILKDTAKWEELDKAQVTSKKLRKANYIELEQAAFLWFQRVTANNAELLDCHLLRKAKELSPRFLISKRKPQQLASALQ